MRKRFFILTLLLPAYLLLVLHAVIPHHHHYSAEDGPLQYHHGYNASHAEHLAVDTHNDPDGHGHTAHFVHSPEFGKAMVKPGIKWIDIQLSIPNYTHPFLYSERISDQAGKVLRHPKGPLLYDDPAVSSLCLRGPPSLAIA